MMITMTETHGALSRLVRERREALGQSQAQVAAASGDDSMLPSYISRLEGGRIRDIPKRDRLVAIARGLDLPVQHVALAAAVQYLGVEEQRGEDGMTLAVATRMSEMTPDERRQIAAMVDAYAASRQRE